MSKAVKEVQARMIDHFGDVGCGKVVEFAPRKQKVLILVPVNTPADAEFGAFNVAGPSLSDLGIFDGDTLIVKRVRDHKRISQDTVCVIRIISTGEIVAKRITKGESMIRLCSTGGGVKDMYVKNDDIEIQGILEQVIKRVDSRGRIKLKELDEDDQF